MTPFSGVSELHHCLVLCEWVPKYLTVGSQDKIVSSFIYIFKECESSFKNEKGVKRDTHSVQNQCCNHWIYM